jgi:glycosyltransferase involved in cell wall biosynthesis
MKMKVVLLNDSYEPIIDGVGMVVKNYAYWLNKKYGTAYVVAPHVPGYKDGNEIPVVRYKSFEVPKRPPYRFGIPALDIPILEKLSHTHFDLIHSHCPFATGQLASLMKLRRDIPHITTFHSKYREDFKRILKSNTLSEVAVQVFLPHYNLADFVWVPNESTGYTLREYGYKGDFEVWPNGTDLAIPSPKEFEYLREEGLKKFEATETLFTFLFVGQHIWEKNTRLIIEALALLKEREIPFRMVFVGSGYAKKEMEILVTGLKLKDRVHFLGLLTDREEIKAVFAAADLFLFPSLYDTSGIVIQEAAAFKIPSVLSRGSNVAAVICDGKNGFCTTAEPAPFADLLEYLVKNPELVKKAGAEAQKTVYKHWESIISGVAERYHEIITAYKKR